MSNTPDEILKQFSNQVYSQAPDFYHTENMKFMKTAEAKEAFYQLILTEVKGLNAEQRQTLAKLFNKEIN